MFRTFLKQIKRKLRDINSQIREECSAWGRHMYNDRMNQRFGWGTYSLSTRDVTREFFDLHDKLLEEKRHLKKILEAFGSDSDESGSDSSDSDDE